jgi:hypothetical protein
MLICIDQLVGCWLRGWYYVWIGGDCPSADETISAFVGRNAIAGKKWALYSEQLIDSLFYRGHCRHAVITDDHD